MKFLSYENTKKEPNIRLFSVLYKMSLIWLNDDEPFEKV